LGCQAMNSTSHVHLGLGLFDDKNDAKWKSSLAEDETTRCLCTLTSVVSLGIWDMRGVEYRLRKKMFQSSIRWDSSFGMSYCTLVGRRYMCPVCAARVVELEEGDFIRSRYHSGAISNAYRIIPSVVVSHGHKAVRPRAIQ
jgi:hypothetical protein